MLIDSSSTFHSATMSEEEAAAAVDPMAALRAEAAKLRHELDEAKSDSAVAELVKENLLDLERQNTSLREELATMQQLLNEAHDEAAAARTGYEHHLAQTKAVVGQLKTENQELRLQMKMTGGGGAAASAALSEAIVPDKDKLLGGAAVITDGARSLARRVKSNLTGVVSSPQLNAEGKGGQGLAGRPASPHSSSSSVAAAASTLDDGMRRAHEDAEMLKSIVVPLEEQIGALKDKLREADALLREHETRQGKALLAADGLAEWLDGKSVEEAMAQLLEKSSSEDLAEGRKAAQEATYVALISARYALMVEELSTSRRERADLVVLLDRERGVVKRLKREAVIAGSEALRAQREHLAEVTRVQGVLNEEQKESLLKQQQQLQQQRTNGGEGTLADDDAGKSPSMASPSKSSDSISTHSSSSSPSVKEEDDEDDAGGDCLSSARLVSAVEWEAMMRELDKMRALLGVGSGDSVVGSDKYRALQAELIELKKSRAGLAKQVEKLKEEAREEDGFRKRLEERWNERAEAHRAETEALGADLAELESSCQRVRTTYSTSYEAIRRDLRAVTADREKIVRELRRLQDEVDALTGKHSAKAAEMQAEPINLPENAEDMQLLLLRLREDLIAAKVAKERAEEKAKSELSFVRDQLRGEEEAKRMSEDQFSQEIESLRSQVARLQTSAAELQQEQQRRREAEERESGEKVLHQTSKQKVAQLEKEKIELEGKVGDMRTRLTTLHQELDNSVAVQNDFVRLSQSLQMELEKIRQAETEVRWQHEDDVADCQGCHTRFPKQQGGPSGGAQRRKHHCRHCGRVFCSDCVAKTVPSGPRRRPAKVCDVCHTLLVQHSAPYFSTSAPTAN